MLKSILLQAQKANAIKGATVYRQTFAYPSLATIQPAKTQAGTKHSNAQGRMSSPLGASVILDEATRQDCMRLVYRGLGQIIAKGDDSNGSFVRDPHANSSLSIRIVSELFPSIYH